MGVLDTQRHHLQRECSKRVFTFIELQCFLDKLLPNPHNYLGRWVVLFPCIVEDIEVKCQDHLKSWHSQNLNQKVCLIPKPMYFSTVITYLPSAYHWLVWVYYFLNSAACVKRLVCPISMSAATKANRMHCLSVTELYSWCGKVT